MLVIYFYEGSEDADAAMALRKQLRAIDINAVTRNAGAYRQENGLEWADAVLTLNCPRIADAYEQRNAAIRAAEERGDTKMFIGTPITEVFRSIEELEQSLNVDEQLESEPTDLSEHTKQELIDLGAERGIELHMSMSKADMLAALQ